MIFKNSFLDENFLSEKTIHRVTEETPLVVLVSNKFTFLNEFIKTSLTLNHVPFEIKQVEDEENMCYHLPAITFKDYFLSQENVVEFIADLMLHKESFTDLMERKALAKNLYKNVFQIIKEEHEGFSSYKNFRALGIFNEQDYYNHLFNLFFEMASLTKSDILERKYEGFRRNEINFENLLIYDTAKSILKLCEKTKADHVLRSYFENIIDFHEEFKIRIKIVLNAENNAEIPTKSIEVVSDKVEEPPKIEYKNFSSNLKKFAIVLTVLSGIYLKWVK